jgi:4'-phosphopantetheinyl transferase
LVLAHDEVHVWRATLDQPSFRTEVLLRTLAADEQTRAGRFYFAKDREHFIVARGVLRAILGGYLNRAPDCLSFCYGAHGKPDLAGEADVDAIRFSVSHSHGAVLYAVARGREVGIDLERVRYDLPVAELAERFFSRSEAARLRALPTATQSEAFLRSWTRKEAYIKALGGGLSIPLDRLDVTQAAGEPGPVLAMQRDPSKAARWSVRGLSATSGYVAALAVEGDGWRLSCWQWQDPAHRIV